VRLLVLTFYFPPDLSAGSFRADSLVRALRECAPGEAEIDVLTTMPNRYASYSEAAEPNESIAGVNVVRCRLPRHRSDILGQSKAFLSYARQVRRYCAGKDYDLVFATSSRLMTAALGASLARATRAPLYLDIRDIFVDTVGDVFPRPIALVLKPILAALESYTMRTAANINLVSRGFEGYFVQRYPRARYSWHTNGIDEEFLLDVGSTGHARPASEVIELVYAGNMGAGQGLHEIVPGLARALGARAKLILVGDGGRRAQLGRACAGLSNVDIRPPVSRQELLEIYREADVLFLHLGRFAAFQKVLPSKIFEYAALGKPILAGVSGYPAKFLEEEVENCAVFDPGDVAGAIAALGELRLETRPRLAFVNKFRRSNISQSMAREICSLMTSP